MTGVPLYGQGWRCDLPDHRDYTLETPAVRDGWAKLRRRRAVKSPLPASVDWREFCFAATDQGPLGSTSAHAVLGMLEYFERRATGRGWQGSPLFAYYNARKLDGTQGDNGAGLRTSLKAIVRFGCPPERHWPNDAAHCDREPDAFAYGFQREWVGLRYVRLDDPSAGGGDVVLRRMKALLAAGFACVCGAVPPASDDDGDLPFPTKFDGVGGGAAYTVVGYDDARRIRSTKGAFIVRGTRGPTFGDAGYGRLPYRYVEAGLARDVWTVWNDAWAASGEFEQAVGA